MGKSRARVPSYYRQSIQNAVNRQINLGRTKTAASLNREAIGQVVSYCFVAAAHDILDFDAGKAAVLTVKMNNAAERYTLDRDKRGARKARIALEDRTTPLMVERFLLPAGKLGKTANEREILAERRDAADMVARYCVEALHDMSYTVEQIAAVMQETRSNFEQFLGWSEDGEMVASELDTRNTELTDITLWTTSNLATIVKTDWVCILRDSLKLTSCLVCFGWIIRSCNNLFQCFALFSVTSYKLCTLNLASFH